MSERKEITVAVPGGQRGVVLILGLIMLLLMTIVGLAAIRGTGLQEAMAGNMRDRNLAFQAAEAGLRDGEEFIRSTDIGDLTFTENASTKGLYTDQNQPDFDPVNTWDAAAWTARGIETDMELKLVSAQPLYVIEEVVLPAQDVAELDGSGIGLGSLGSVAPVEIHRLTSRGAGGSPNSTAVVQANFRKN